MEGEGRERQAGNRVDVGQDKGVTIVRLGRALEIRKGHGVSGISVV